MTAIGVPMAYRSRNPDAVNCGGGWRKLVPAFAGNEEPASNFGGDWRMDGVQDDLVKRLRSRCACPRCSECESERSDAASELERMAARIAELEHAVLVCNDGRIKALARAEELEQEKRQAIEIAMIRHTNLTPGGKTILDFHEVWLRQAHEYGDKMKAERDAAIARAEAAEQDAARYRWLREGTPHNPLVIFVDSYRGDTVLSYVALDAAIDRDMTQYAARASPAETQPEKR